MKVWPIYMTARVCKANVLPTGDHRDFGFLVNAPERADELMIQPIANFGCAESSHMTLS